MRNKTHSYSVLSPLQGRRIFVQLVITFRHGREEDETLGLSFKKELVLDRVQIYPPEKAGVMNIWAKIRNEKNLGLSGT